MPHDAYSRREAVPDDYYRAFMKCWRDPSGDVIVKFHKTNVVTIRPNGDVVLFTNTYFTYTTLCSMNDALQWIDMKVSARGDVRDPGNWTVTVVGNSPQPFSDNMVVKARFTDDRNRGQEVLEGLLPMLGHANTAAATAQQGGLARTAVARPAAAAAPPPPPAAAAAAPAVNLAPPKAGWGAGGTTLAARLAAENKAAEAGKKEPSIPGAVFIDEKPVKKQAKKQAAAAAANNGNAAGAGSTSSNVQTSAARPASASTAGGASSNVGHAAAAAAFSSLSISGGGGGGGGSGGGGSAGGGDVFPATLLPSGPTPAAANAITELLNQHAAVWGEAEADDGKLCAVCMHHRSSTILIPCSHAVLCRGCADSVVELTPGTSGECPVCRTPVDLVLDVA